MGKPNFIVIDDDKVMLFLIEFELRREFKHSTILSYVKSDMAVKYIQDHIAELENTIVLLDLNMPVMDGFQVLAILNSIPEKLNVIIVSSSIREEDKSKTLAYPFVLDFMSKPIKAGDLKQILLRIET